MVNNHAGAMLAAGIKMLALNAVNSTSPTQFSFGTVETTNPLSIRLNQKMVLSDAFLILTNAVKDHSVDISVSWNTLDETHKHENGNNGKPTAEVTHKHGIQGRKKITIHNGLTVGEKVILFRVQGGQSYVVIDRVDEIPNITGESV